MSILISLRTIFLPTILLAVSVAQAAPADDALAQGVALRNGGNLQLAIETFSALRTSEDKDASVAAGGELGTTLLQARRLDEAEPYLRDAYGKTVAKERARYAVELGNLAAARGQAQQALRFYREAQTLAGGDSALALVARIDATRLAERKEQPTLLAAISLDLAAIAEPSAQARMRLSLGTLASAAGSLKLAYENLDKARALAAQANDARIEIEALDALAQVYEGQGRNADALLLSRRAIARARTAEGMVTDILLRLEWRQGRLLAAQDANNEARAAYQRAIEHIESIRKDIPVEYQDGRSSFRDTLGPIYLGYIDLLLKQAGKLGGSEQAGLLRRARGIAELSKQSELQDYLGERCSVDSAQNDVQAGVAPGTAIIYPVILKDRIEVIFESGASIMRHATAMDAQSLRQLVLAYTSILRAGEDDYRIGAGQLYEILIRPFEKTLETQGVRTLLVVPDGVLRLLPWTTLYDGKQFLVEKYALVINSGLSMTSQEGGRAKGFTALVAGMAEPGPVVEKLSHNSLVQVVEPAATRSGFAVKGVKSRGISLSERSLSADSPENITRLRESLALPGVKTEIDALSKILPGTSLLDATFTTGRLHDEVEKGEYRIVHIATHGYFGSSGDQSYIMAYDDLVTMNGLQKLLQLEGVKKNPIELLTLSACETAEGDDRSPLGIAGAAIKAKAKSVLGTLWPVSDSAAQQVMTKFYGSLVHDGVSKAEALRRAQVALIGSSDLNLPFYWAPFIIVGNWQ